MLNKEKNFNTWKKKAIKGEQFKCKRHYDLLSHLQYDFPNNWRWFGPSASCIIHKNPVKATVKEEYAPSQHISPLFLFPLAGDIPKVTYDDVVSDYEKLGWVPIPGVQGQGALHYIDNDIWHETGPRDHCQHCNLWPVSNWERVHVHDRSWWFPFKTSVTLNLPVLKYLCIGG